MSVNGIASLAPAFAAYLQGYRDGTESGAGQLKGRDSRGRMRLRVPALEVLGSPIALTEWVRRVKSTVKVLAEAPDASLPPRAGHVRACSPE